MMTAPFKISYHLMGILRGGTRPALALQPKFPLVSTRLMFRVKSEQAGMPVEKNPCNHRSAQRSVSRTISSFDDDEVPFSFTPAAAEEEDDFNFSSSTTAVVHVTVV